MAPLGSVEAVVGAWETPAERADFHTRLRQHVRDVMPDLARALDRLSEEYEASNDCIWLVPSDQLEVG